MKILHLCEWSGITTRNVRFLKQYSKHQHEIVARIVHPYLNGMGYEHPTYLESTTDKETVLAMAEEADVLHFHAYGYDFQPSIHRIDWSQFLGRKKFAVHGMCSFTDSADPDAKFTVGYDKFIINRIHEYDLVMGPHLSCKRSYCEWLQYVPDMVPIFDWLYTPSPVAASNRTRAFTFKNPEVVSACIDARVPLIQFPTPSLMPSQLQIRRFHARVNFDNATDGHWGLFGIESLSQGVPCATWVHPMNRECWKILGVSEPPFLTSEFRGGNVPRLLADVFRMPEKDWNMLSNMSRNWIVNNYQPEDLVRRWDDVYGTIE